MKQTKQLYDAIAVNKVTSMVRIFGENKTKKNAETISAMAVMRRGCDEEIFAETKAGEYKEGDIYKSAT